MHQPATAPTISYPLNLGAENLDEGNLVAGNLDAGSLKVAIKECLAIKDLPTRCGSEAFSNAPTEANHSDIVSKLIEQGCHIIGLTTMHELAFGVTGINKFAGTAVNPKWPNRIVGGSSSGSAAAVAAGMVDFSIGTDTGGSIRQPACCCGIYGLKPTIGAVSRQGAIPRQSSLDCIGPFAASADMLARAASIILPDFTPTTIDRPKLKQVNVECDASISSSLEAALGDLKLPAIKLDHLKAAYDAGLVIINYELANCWGDLARSDAKLGKDVRARIIKALETTQEQYEQAEDIRTKFSNEVDMALEDFDALVLPTLPSTPPLLLDANDPSVIFPTTKLVRPFNLSGHPALTIPLLTADGLPAGMQLVGRKNDEARLCAIAQWFSITLNRED